MYLGSDVVADVLVIFVEDKKEIGIFDVRTLRTNWCPGELPGRFGSEVIFRQRGTNLVILAKPARDTLCF